MPWTLIGSMSEVTNWQGRRSGLRCSVMSWLDDMGEGVTTPAQDTGNCMGGREAIQ